MSVSSWKETLCGTWLSGFLFLVWLNQSQRHWEHILVLTADTWNTLSVLLCFTLHQSYKHHLSSSTNYHNMSLRFTTLVWVWFVCGLTQLCIDYRLSLKLVKEMYVCMRWASLHVKIWVGWVRDTKSDDGCYSSSNWIETLQSWRHNHQWWETDHLVSWCDSNCSWMQ